MKWGKIKAFAKENNEEQMVWLLTQRQFLKYVNQPNNIDDGIISCMSYILRFGLLPFVSRCSLSLLIG